MSRRHRQLLAVICALAVCLAFGVFAAGCGGSDDSGSTSRGESTEQTAALTKDAYIKRGDTICEVAVRERTQDYLARVRKLEKEGEQVTPQIQLELVEEIYVPKMDRMVDELEALEPPPAQAEELEEIVGDYRDKVELVEEDPQNAIPPGLWNEPAELARDFGFIWCAEM